MIWQNISIALIVFIALGNFNDRIIWLYLQYQRGRIVLPHGTPWHVGRRPRPGKQPSYLARIISTSSTLQVFICMSTTFRLVLAVIFFFSFFLTGWFLQPFPPLKREGFRIWYYKLMKLDGKQILFSYFHLRNLMNLINISAAKNLITFCWKID